MPFSQKKLNFQTSINFFHFLILFTFSQFYVTVNSRFTKQIRIYTN